MDPTELEGTLFGSKLAVKMDLYMSSCKSLYKGCVVVSNSNVLAERKDTVWRTKFKVPSDCRPVWRVFYKGPLSKRVGDLQWRILQGALAVNSFISKINSTVSMECPFCQL